MSGDTGRTGTGDNRGAIRSLSLLLGRELTHSGRACLHRLRATSLPLLLMQMLLLLLLLE